MLNTNIKTLRKSKGLSQEELAIKMNVVRQTISKWENGISVPDSDMLISLSKIFETSISNLLGEGNIEIETDNINKISEKLEIINLQLAKNKEIKRRKYHYFFGVLSITIIVIFSILMVMKSPYLNWNYSKIENGVIGVLFHSFEWLFIRISPLLLIASVIGFFRTKKSVAK
ncbi:helix-turn-helix domain-containing protein [Helcococcus kunzii]